MEQLKYCSIDLELTGFDPANDEILEVGFIFFTMGNTGIQVLEEWTQVFRPHREVHPKILGLTGIRQAELDAAPEFNEHRKFLQEKLGDAILVGHSVSVDARFLEAAGIRLSGAIADTLDLVQFLLPTHHSYNLQNLMHYFGINHEEAHRALADSKASIAVIERLLGIFNSLSPKLRKEIQELATQGHFHWASWLNNGSAADTEPQSTTPTQTENANNVIELNENSIISIPKEPNTDEVVIGSIKEPSAYIVESKETALNLWKEGIVEGVFVSEDTFDPDRFASFRNKQNLSPDEIKFILKILVWQETNWQSSCLLDLNTSFFGGQFKWLINGGVTPAPGHLVICCDHKTFIKNSNAPYYNGRRLVIKSLYDFEKTLTTGIGERVSWNYTIQVIKGIYNPELDHGNRTHKEVVIDALAATDLFFGLLNLTIERHFHSQLILEFKEFAANTYYFNKVHKAAEHYADRLAKLGDETQTPELQNIAKHLVNIFTEQENRVKWIEIGETRCVLYNLPLDITSLTTQLLAQHPTTFVDISTDKRSFEYLAARLGISSFNLTIAPTKRLTSPSTTVRIFTETPTNDRLLSYCNENARPTILQFPNLANVKGFYDQYYQDLKTLGPVFGERYSGGSNKITRNFSISPQSVLLVTGAFMLRQNHKKIPAKTVVWVDLPTDGYTHPYQKALAKNYSQLFPDFENILGLLQLQILLDIYHTKKIEKIDLFLPNHEPTEVAQIKKFLETVPWMTVIPTNS